ncbi:lasso peptide biosynthesis PqqD family chaperone [Streptosporangium jomthongense]|uniref:Lasso peptide biosynthesis PqqD family chaperone n=1 Tax=Streptosporangium jomthongense TaxID=1193683 RepID=A0ABV8F803_9ACTN
MSLALCPDVTLYDTGQALILLDTRRGRYWQTNATGAEVLRALLGGTTADQLADQLVRRQPVTHRQAADDIAALLDDLRRTGLVRS